MAPCDSLNVKRKLYMVDRICKACGVSLDDRPSRAKYCSHKCARDYWNHTFQARKNAWQREDRITKDRSEERAYDREQLRASPFFYLIRCAKQRAKHRKFSFDLTLEWARSIWTGRCALTDIPMVVNPGNRGPSPMSPSLDRIDNTKGYLQSNCRFILSGLNSLKGIGGDDQMLAIARALVARHG